MGRFDGKGGGCRKEDATGPGAAQLDWSDDQIEQSFVRGRWPRDMGNSGCLARVGPCSRLPSNGVRRTADNCLRLSSPPTHHIPQLRATRPRHSPRRYAHNTPVTPFLALITSLSIFLNKVRPG